jgi:hypothetical protein
VIDFKATKEDSELIDKIIERAHKLFKNFKKVDIDLLELNMDICATHLNGCNLSLEKLLSFDNSNFLHDVIGINRNIDRKTGKLENCFIPRCARLPMCH